MRSWDLPESILEIRIIDMVQLDTITDEKLINQKPAEPVYMQGPNPTEPDEYTCSYTRSDDYQR